MREGAAPGLETGPHCLLLSLCPAGPPRQPHGPGHGGAAPRAGPAAAPRHPVPGHGLGPPGHHGAAAPRPPGAERHRGHLPVSARERVHLCAPAQSWHLLCTYLPAPGAGPFWMAAREGSRDCLPTGGGGVAAFKPTPSSLSRCGLCLGLLAGRGAHPREGSASDGEQPELPRHPGRACRARGPRWV